MACTVHTRGPNRGIGRQKSNRARLVSRKQNGGLPQEASRFVFNDAVGRRGEKNGQQNSFRFFLRHFETERDGSWVLKRRLFNG